MVNGILRALFEPIAQPRYEHFGDPMARTG